MRKIIELISLKITPPKTKSGLSRKTLVPEIVDIQNTIFKNDYLVSVNNDTNITIQLCTPTKYIKIVANIGAENTNTQTQVFYRTDVENFTEQNSIKFRPNQTQVEYIVSSKPITSLRLDAINTNGKFEINHFEIIKISKSEHKLAQRLNTAKKIRAKIKQDSTLIKKFITSIKNNGLKTAITKVKSSLHKDAVTNTLYNYIEPKLTDEIKEKLKNFSHQPLISIIMPVYNVNPKWLDLAIKSVEAQWYENWELCIADDKSTKPETIKYLKNTNNPKIKVRFLEQNLNISGASNAALELACGEYIALMDNDDEITPDALHEVVKVINETGAEFIYSDEDKLEMDGSFSDPHFKPDFAPDMFLSQNYISHLGVIKKSLIEMVGGFTLGLEGAQDYDLYLKVFEHTDRIYHIQKILYHWRKISGSSAAEFSDKAYTQDAGVRALQHAMYRRNIAAQVESGKYPGTYRVKYAIKDNPLVSIIVPFKDKPELLVMCIESILNKSTYKNFEIIGISNKSNEQVTFNEMRRLEKLDSRIKFYEYNVPFNYSAINNYAVHHYVRGEHIILLNNDIEIITPAWIENMLEYSQREDVGAVGAKLYFPDNSIQHAGVILGKGDWHGLGHGVAGHAYSFFNEDMHYDSMNMLNCAGNYHAVTAACMMVKKELFDQIGGFNEVELTIAFNDVDLCLRLEDLGLRNIYTPYAQLYHYESISRGSDAMDKEKQKRYTEEVNYMFKKYLYRIKNDKFYNKNLSLTQDNYLKLETI